jgi:hypothetical protein
MADSMLLSHSREFAADGKRLYCKERLYDSAAQWEEEITGWCAPCVYVCEVRNACLSRRRRRRCCIIYPRHLPFSSGAEV